MINWERIEAMANEKSGLCSQCACHQYVESRHVKFSSVLKTKQHFCICYINHKTSEGVKGKTYYNHLITQGEFERAPSWCPKTVRSLHKKTGICKVVSIEPGTFEHTVEYPEAQ
jgi:hypothetical protein